MITPESTDTVPDASQSTRSWVWHSTDDSIAAGQISLLSVLETFCALGLYGWLAFHFEHQWWLLISAVAAPIILLRSPKSKALGVKWLHHYWDIKDQTPHPKTEKITSAIIAISLGLLASYLLQKYIPVLPGITNHIARIEIITTISTFIMAIGFYFSGSPHLTGLPHFKSFLELKKHSDIFFFVLLFSLGAWLRILIIRIVATVLFLTHGLRQLSCNWKEILWVIDITHPPELLPDAGKVDDIFTVRGLLKKRASTAERLITNILITCWYPPAMMWRWSLKATLWLWFPLALLLRPPFEGKSLEQVRDIAAIRVVASKWLGFVALLGILLLTASYIPGVQAWVDTLGDSISKPFTKLAEFHLPPPGLRQWALWLCCGLAGLEWLSLVLLQARHRKLLEEEDSIYGGIPEIRLQTFLQRARKVQWLHTALVVSFILFGYTIVLHLINTWYPAELTQFIPAWLIGWL
jgi:hypothetical protein